MNLIESHHLTDPVTVTRTWRERLLTWPWRPLQRTKVVQVPSPKVFVANDFGGMICHPDTAAKLRQYFPNS